MGSPQPICCHYSPNFALIIFAFYIPIIWSGFKCGLNLTLGQSFYFNIGLCYALLLANLIQIKMRIKPNPLPPPATILHCRSQRPQSDSAVGLAGVVDDLFFFFFVLKHKIKVRLQCNNFNLSCFDLYFIQHVTL